MRTLRSSILPTLPGLVLAFAITPLQAAPDAALLEAERQACLAQAEGAVADAAASCDCVIEGLAQSLSQEDYLALVALMNGGAATPEGEAARVTAQAVVQQCFGG